MAIREIIPLGDPRLREVAAPVERIDDELRALVADMFETMIAAPGIGLAATQVAVPLRVIVISLDGDEFEVLNPELLWASEREETDVEACLSLPGVQAMVRRPAKVRVRGVSIEGDEFELSAEGLAARCLLHEMDHLEGVVFLDRVEDERVRWREGARGEEIDETEEARFLSRADVFRKFEERYAQRAGAAG